MIQIVNDTKTNKTLQRIVEIIDSCKTKEQLDNCLNFADPKYFNFCDIVNNYIINQIVRKQDKL